MANLSMSTLLSGPPPVLINSPIAAPTAMIADAATN